MNKFYTLFLFSMLITNFISAQTEATLLGTWDDPELIGSNNYDNTYNEIWGVAINGVEYAVIGSTAGTHFINISDNPSQPFEEHFVAGASSGGQIIHRDFHDYKGYLYVVADEGESTLQIIDLRCLPDEINVVYDSKQLIKRAHNIFIDDEAGRLYAFATRNGVNSSNAMRIYSLDNPINPVLLAEHRVFDGITIGHVHDGWVNDNLAFLNCGGDALFVVDFTDPLNPVTKDKILTYPDQGYNHSGWPTEDLQYYYMADENHGHDLKVIDISDLEDVFVEGTFNAGVSNSNMVTHNQIVNCDYLYTSYYYDGLQVFDISDPKNPVKVSYYDTYTFSDGNSFKGAWGVYPLLPSGKILLSDMQSGLYVFAPIDNECDNSRSTSNDIASECIPTALDNQVAKLINVYPNPVLSGGILNVEVKSSFTNIRLVNINGQIVHDWNNEESAINQLTIPSNLSKGFYMLEAIAKNGTYSKQSIVVQ